jgi:hypothetical protein
MSDSQLKETAAFISFFATFRLSKPVKNIADLSDGVALTEVLSLVYASLNSPRGCMFTSLGPQRCRLLPPADTPVATVVRELGPALQLTEATL